MPGYAVKFKHMATDFKILFNALQKVTTFYRNEKGKIKIVTIINYSEGF